MIDEITVNKIHDAARVEEVVGDFVTLRRRGVNLLGLCPFHDEKTPSFTVSPAKGIFKCFGCGKGGNALHFVMEHEQCTYVEALKYVAKKYHIEVVEKELTSEEIATKNERESLFAVNEYAQKYFTKTLLDHSEGRSIGLSYFKERAFTQKVIDRFQLGYSLNVRDAFTAEALKSGYKEEFLVKTGLTITGDNHYRADRFRGRVLFPIHSLAGKVLGFGGRILKKNEKTAKYLNSPESEIYHKSNVLYGIYQAKQSIIKFDRCFLVEGYTDVISMHQNGIENVVASSGTALTPGQIRLIHRFTENVTVLYDGDAAGIKASLRGIDLLLEEGLNVKVLLLPMGEDPDSFAQKSDAATFIKYIEDNSLDFIRFKTKILLEDAGDDPIRRAKLVSDIVGSISLIPNQLIRTEYIKITSELLNVSEKTLYQEVNKQLQELKLRKQKQSTQKNSTSLPLLPPQSFMPPKNQNTQERPPTNTIISRYSVVGELERKEQLIVELLLKYGTKILYYDNVDDNGIETNPVTVSEYIYSDLEADEITFKNVNFNFILNEYKRQSEVEGFDPQRYFINHSDSIISQIAIDIVADKEPLSRIHSKFQKIESDEERLMELTERFVLELKMQLLKEKQKALLSAMRSAELAQKSDKIMRLQKEFNSVSAIIRDIATVLDRVLNR